MSEATREQPTNTQTVTEVIEEEEVLPPINIAGTLHLQGRNVGGPTVHWTEDTVDNENLGRKKSKICCIYTRPRNWDDSSSSESSSCDSSDDDDKPNAYEIQPKYKPRSHHHHGPGGCKHK